MSDDAPIVYEDFLTIVKRESEKWLNKYDTAVVQKNMLEIYDVLVKNNSGNIEGALSLIYLLINIGPIEHIMSYNMYKNICSYLFMHCDPPILQETQGNA